MIDLSSPAIYVPTIFITLLAIFIAVLCKDSQRHTSDNTKDLPYYYEIGLSMGYLGRNLKEDGRFVYRRNVDSEIKYDNTVYNSLRHAGTLYSMYLYEQMGLETRYKEARINSSLYFVNRYIKKVNDKMSVVLSLPEEEGIKFPIAKSGAAGVALAALCNLTEDAESKETITLELMRELGEFLLFMQSEDGQIYAYYDINKKMIDKKAQAMFYPGEAAFGLLSLYEIDPRQKWLDGAIKAIMYLANERKDMDLDMPFDHWSVLVIEKLIEKNLLNSSQLQTLKTYAEHMAIPILSNQITNPNNSYYGAFKDNVRPGSIGTIMEGLASVYFCTDNEPLKRIISKSLSIGNYFLSKTQVKTGTQAGGMPNSANWVKPGVTPNASVIRIDNIQHVVIGWLKYQNILKVTQNY